MPQAAIRMPPSRATRLNEKERLAIFAGSDIMQTVVHKK
jgi:hypothetical protein